MEKSEHEPSKTNGKLIATPAKPAMSQNHGQNSPFQMAPRIAPTDDPGGRENGHLVQDQVPTAHPGTDQLHRTLASALNEVLRGQTTNDDYSIPQLLNITPPTTTPAGRV